MTDAVKTMISSNVVPWHIKEGNTEELKMIVESLSEEEKKYLVNYTYKAGCTDVTPLQEAVLQGNSTIVEFLLDCGAEPNQATGDFNQSLLHRVVSKGQDSIAESLLKAGANPDWIPRKRRGGLDPLDVSPLCAACREGDLVIVNLLLQHGAQVERRDFRRETCLFHAVRSGCRDVIDVLLNQGASVKVLNAYKESPVTLAKTSWPEIVDVLVAAQKGHSSKTGRHRASDNESDSPAKALPVLKPGRSTDHSVQSVKKKHSR